MVYTASGVYTETLSGANSAGCDSIVTLDLTVNNTTLGTDVQSSCDSLVWIDGNTYTSNNYSAMHTLMNSVGCDSIVILNFTITSNSATDVQTVCDSYTWIDGNTYTSDNDSATFTLTNSAGCDSLVTLDLTITNSSSGTDNQTACSDFTWIDGNTYTSDNNSATFTLSNSVGCDSIVTLDLTINTVSSSVTQAANGVVLTADETGATYQWLNCPGFTPIVGETNQTFTAMVNGDYAVIVSNGTCTDTSACSSVTTVGTVENELENSLSVYPNPTNGEFTIDFGQKVNEVNVSLTDLVGKQIGSKIYTNDQLLNLKIEEPSGVYLLIVESENKRVVVRLVKE